MKLEDFVKNFATQFENAEVHKVTPETNFRDLEDWSSLIALSVIAMVDEEYQVVIRGEDIRKAITVNDLYEIVKSKQ